MIGDWDNLTEQQQRAMRKLEEDMSRIFAGWTSTGGKGNLQGYLDDYLDRVMKQPVGELWPAEHHILAEHAWRHVPEVLDIDIGAMRIRFKLFPREWTKEPEPEPEPVPVAPPAPKREGVDAVIDGLFKE